MSEAPAARAEFGLLLVSGVSRRGVVAGGRFGIVWSRVGILNAEGKSFGKGPSFRLSQNFRGDTIISAMRSDRVSPLYPM